MKRREFLKKAGVGSAAFASVPVAFGTLSAPVSAANRPVGFRIVSNSRTATVAGVRHLAQLNGDGVVTNSQVIGAGRFNHVLDTSPVPKTILASGTWKARQLISFNLIGSYGSIAAGILEMWIHLVRTDGAVVPAKLEIVCNLGAAGLTTGEEEGFVLDIPGTPFTVGGTFGPFIPFVPVPGGPTNGLSVFNLLNEQKD